MTAEDLDTIKNFLNESKSKLTNKNKNFMDYIFGPNYEKQSNPFDDGVLTINGKKFKIEVKEQEESQWLDIRKYAKGLLDNQEISDAIFIYYDKSASIGKVKYVLIVDMKKWITNHYRDIEHILNDEKYREYFLDNTRDASQTKTSYDMYDILSKNPDFEGCVKMAWPFDKSKFKNGA